MTDSTDSGLFEASLFRIMTLLATLNTAAEVKFGLEERRAGRDPSDQEDPVLVRPFLLEAEDELRTTLVQLRASFSFAQHTPETTVAMQVRRFSDLTRFHAVSGLLQRIHQRLMSLYPAISESLTEEARALHVECQSLSDAEDVDYFSVATHFVDRALLFCDWLQGEVDATLPHL